MPEKTSVDTRLGEIVSGFRQRIESGTIPKVNYYVSNFTKADQACKIRTDKGLEIEFFASEGMDGIIENVTLSIKKIGQDIKLRELIKEKHGDVLIRKIEVSMRREFPSDEIGKGKLIDPPIQIFVSPDIIQALMERIPLMPS